MDASDDKASGFTDSSLLRVINALEKDYTNGDSEALMSAVFFCCHLQESAMPRWVADNVKDGLVEWSEFKVGTLDEAYNGTKPEGFHLNANRKEREKKFAVYCRINQLAESGEGKDEQLFEKVGKEFFISAGTAKSYFYKQKNTFRDFLK